MGGLGCYTSSLRVLAGMYYFLLVIVLKGSKLKIVVAHFGVHTIQPTKGYPWNRNTSTIRWLLLTPQRFNGWGRGWNSAGDPHFFAPVRELKGRVGIPEIGWVQCKIACRCYVSMC